MGQVGDMGLGPAAFVDVLQGADPFLAGLVDQHPAHPHPPPSAAGHREAELDVDLAMTRGDVAQRTRDPATFVGMHAADPAEAERLGLGLPGERLPPRGGNEAAIVGLSLIHI